MEDIFQALDSEQHMKINTGVEQEGVDGSYDMQGNRRYSNEDTKCLDFKEIQWMYPDKKEECEALESTDQANCNQNDDTGTPLDGTHDKLVKLEHDPSNKEVVDLHQEQYESCKELLDIKQELDIINEYEADVKQLPFACKGSFTRGYQMDTSHAQVVRVKEESDPKIEQIADLRNTCKISKEGPDDIKLEIGVKDDPEYFAISNGTNRSQADPDLVLQVEPLVTELKEISEHCELENKFHQNDHRKWLDLLQDRDITMVNRPSFPDSYSTLGEKGHVKKYGMNRTSDKSHLCELCQYKCQKAEDMKRHLLVHTDEKPYSCGKCQYTCRRVSQLKHHERTHTGVKPYSCDLCQYKCQRSIDLKFHKMTHTDERPYKCERCPHAFRQIKALKQHKIAHTNEYLYVCDICHYKFRRAGHLKRHMKTHASEKHHLCDKCSYMCLRADQMKEHKMIHAVVKPYSCDLCQFSCNRAGNMKRHKMTHTGEKPYSCDVCQYTCRTAEDLKKHKMKHTSTKPFKCDKCPFACKRSEGLKKHKRRHTDVKPYTCDLCPYASRQAIGLKRHKMTHIGDKESSPAEKQRTLRSKR